MSMTDPDLSVVIPCYNAEKWIARAIESVLVQDGPNLEIMVVDDGSTDGSLEIITSFGDRIRWVSGGNHGASAARNRGLSLSASDYVLFLDADDYLVPGRWFRGSGPARLPMSCSDHSRTNTDVIAPPGVRQASRPMPVPYSVHGWKVGLCLRARLCGGVASWKRLADGIPALCATMTASL